MSNGDVIGAKKGLPGDFFTAASLSTLSGCAVAAWVVSGVISGLFKISPVYIGFAVSIVIAYAAMFISEQKSKGRYFITFLNGILIYATVAGATSFTPFINRSTAGVVEGEKPTVGTVLLRPWIPDRNLVAATRQLINVKDKQEALIGDLTGQFMTVRSAVQNLEAVPASQKTELLELVNRNLMVIEKTHQSVDSNFKKKEQLGHMAKPAYPKH